MPHRAAGGPGSWWGRLTTMSCCCTKRCSSTALPVLLSCTALPACSPSARVQPEPSAHTAAAAAGNAVAAEGLGMTPTTDTGGGLSHARGHHWTGRCRKPTPWWPVRPWDSPLGFVPLQRQATAPCPGQRTRRSSRPPCWPAGGRNAQQADTPQGLQPSLGARSASRHPSGLRQL